MPPNTKNTYTKTSEKWSKWSDLLHKALGKHALSSTVIKTETPPARLLSSHEIPLAQLLSYYKTPPSYVDWSLPRPNSDSSAATATPQDREERQNQAEATYAPKRGDPITTSDGESVHRFDTSTYYIDILPDDT